MENETCSYLSHSSFHREVFSENSFSPVPDDVAQWTPLKYFKQFWNDKITNMLVKQTNLHSAEQSGVNINTYKDEIEKHIAVQLLMSIVKMPRYEMYWSEATRYEPVASTLTLKRYKKLREFLHIVDNTEKEKPVNKEVKCFRVKPWLEAVRASCQKVEQEVNNSTDEEIILAKTNKSGGVQQYNPKKPHKWGFKNLVRAGESGVIYDFFLCGGKNSTGGNSCSTESIVLKLSERIPKNEGYRLFFDNWFSPFNLLQLKSSGIFTKAIFCTNRLKRCPLASDKELKKEGRGSYDY